MADQQRKTVRRPEPRREETEATPAVGEKGEQLKKNLDELLEEIDAVLEENAEEFVKNYIQRGGE